MSVVALAPQAVADAIQQRFAMGVRFYVGRGKLFSPQMLACAIGVSDSLIEKYALGANMPGYATAMRLFAALPESFANHQLEMAGLTGAYRISDAAPKPAKTLTEQLEAASALAAALEDGRVDHAERAKLAPMLRALGSKLLETAAEWSRAA